MPAKDFTGDRKQIQPFYRLYVLIGAGGKRNPP